MTAAAESIDFLTYYDLEKYLFEVVSPQFATERTLSAFHFFCIVIWKANRAKSKIAKRLLEHGPYSDLDTAVGVLLAEVVAAHSPKDRLRVMMSQWGLLLPMASAILTILYPDEFTVYDVNVCDVIGDFHKLKNKINFDRIWDGYANYTEAVKRTAPAELSLRDKDRWAWGKAFVLQLNQDIANNFPRRDTDDADA